MPTTSIKNIRAIIAAAMISAVTAGTAYAQLDNKPYSFKNSPGGGVGMSVGGRQAIINEKLFDSTPHNLQRGPDGSLVDVTEGPGKSAIIFRNGTTSVIPGFSGTSFRGQNALMQVGVFNPYFASDFNSTSLPGIAYSQFYTTSAINSWTGSVSSQALLFSPNGGSPVDKWTIFVHSMDRF